MYFLIPLLTLIAFLIVVLFKNVMTSKNNGKPRIKLLIAESIPVIQVKEMAYYFRCLTLNRREL